jgi:hypothetical protein
MRETARGSRSRSVRESGDKPNAVTGCAVPAATAPSVDAKIAPT